jgi:hypothetical protein
MVSPRHDIEKMINEVLEEFDFEKVYLTMKALNWTWATVPGCPSIDRLKDTAEYLLRGCIEGAVNCKNLREYESYHHATGGFKAYCYRNKFKHIVSLHLEFIVTEWQSDGDT